MLIIGESLNATIPSVGQAVISRDEGFVTALATRQVECGAQMLDANAGGLAGRDEVEDLVWLVQVVQSAVQAPLVLDSGNPVALEAAMDVYHGPRPILSSLTAEPKRLESLLPLAVKHRCGLLVLCLGEKGIPADPEGRLAVAETLITQATTAGLAHEDLFVDPLVMTMSANYRAGAILLSTLRLIRDRFPRVHTVCGASNIGFGMPQRKLLNRTFVASLAALGMDSLMIDVRDRELMATLIAAKALAGEDEWLREYFGAYRAGKL